MAIQLRKGLEKDFKSEKMLPGEMAVTTDTRKIFATFAPGDCKRMATYEDMEEDIREVTGDIVLKLTEGVNSAIAQTEQAVSNTNQAITNADQAASQALTAKQEADQAAQEAKDAAEDAMEAIKGIGETTGDNVVSFASNDCGPEGDPALLSVEKLTSGEKLKDLFNKVSRIVTNVRYLIKLLGNNDISTLGDGTVTGAINAINEALSGKQGTVAGAASTITANNLTASMALVSSSTGKVAVSAVTATELGYLDGVTANIQSQIDDLNNIKITQTSGWIDPGAVRFNIGNYSGSWQSGGVQYSWIQIDCGVLQMQISISNVTHALLIRTKINSQTWSSIPWRTI